jgi:UDP-N-acetylmuramoyl-L-alanyl-D-glutamate--2,6-diaminopimelate ligase
MDEYFRTKCRLFYELLDGTAVINTDDPYGRELAGSIAGTIEGRRITYGIEQGAELAALDAHTGRDGVSFTMSFRGESIKVKSPLVGRPNISNILAMAGACAAIGIDMKHAAAAASNPPPVEGRFMRVEEGQDFLCLIDYAHSPDALERLIKTAREFTASGRVITLFGCGGDRDRTKRPVMGAIATGLSDFVVITTDNPRSEEPQAIIEEIASGASLRNFEVIPDRAEAIRRAVSEARAGDTLLIAGKGHEEYQEAMGKRTPFSDRVHAVDAIRARLKSRKTPSAQKGGR